MVADGEGFLRPSVDVSACVRCGLCKEVCPVENRQMPRKPLKVFAAIAHSQEIRDGSSSGGVFPLLARDCLSRGGIVFGAAVDEKTGGIHHVPVHCTEDLWRILGSKYVQSEIGETYREVDRYLKEGHEVLFSGTPCQIAGLSSFIRFSSAPVEKLLLVDVVCHAVPSPLAWRKYLEFKRNGLRASPGVSRIRFRDKRMGWRRFGLDVRFASGHESYACQWDDPFMQGFLHELYNRPSCHSCAAKGLSSGCDVTLGDYWGIRAKYPEMDDDRGVSLVLISTTKGISAIERVRSDMKELRPCSFEDAISSTGAIVSSVKPHKNRGRFFKCVDTVPFDRLVSRLLRRSIVIRVFWKCGSFGKRMFRMIGGF